MLKPSPQQSPPDQRSTTLSRSPSPTIVSHSEFPDSPYIRDSTLTKSGATLTLGPYHDFPGFTQLGLDEFEVHYKYDAPLVSARKLKRAVEVRRRSASGAPEWQAEGLIASVLWACR